MTVPSAVAEKIRARILQGGTAEEVLQILLPRLPHEDPLPPHVPAGTDHSDEALERRRSLLREQGIQVEQLTGRGPGIPPSELEGNIENFVGFARIPVGVIGPLRVNGIESSGDYYVPMATTEGALLASYQRGSNVISHAGGASVMCTTESVARSPCFVFEDLYQSTLFLAWAIPQFGSLQEIVARTSRHCQLNDVKTTLIGKEVYLSFDYSTGDASGQNMVTIATDAICRDLIEKSPIKPQCWYVEGNMSGDKKATMLSFVYARGKKVVADVTIPGKLVRRFLHVEPADMVRCWTVQVEGGIQSGSIGVQGHFANALAAIFIACGQDVACVAEAAIGLNHFEVTGQGDLYVSVVLPNLIVGTVGGGTHLPTARECLAMMGCYGTGKARKFAEIVCVTVLAGEISIHGAMAAGHFTGAHATYGRKKGKTPREANT